MKNLLTILVVFTMLGVTANANNKPASPTGIAVMKSATGIKLFYKNETAGNVKVTIYNDEGEAVFTETINNIEGFVRPYNFAELKEGEYTIELIDKSGKSVHEYIHQKSTPKNLTYLTRVKDKNNKYVLSVPNKGPNHLTIKIFNNVDQLLYTEDVDVNGDFAQVYDLSDAGESFVFTVSGKNGLSTRLATR